MIGSCSRCNNSLVISQINVTIDYEIQVVFECPTCDCMVSFLLDSVTEKVLKDGIGEL